MATELEIAGKGPPRSVEFGDHFASIPAIGQLLDRPLSIQTDARKMPDLGHISLGGWIDEGSPLARFRLQRKNQRGFLRSLLYELVSGPFHLPLYSPAAGLVLDKGDIFLGNPSGAMLTLLLPKEASLPETVEGGFGRFCDLCLQHKDAIFRSRYLVRESGIETVLSTWPDAEIGRLISTLKTAKITVSPVQGSDYEEQVAEIRRRHSAGAFGE